MVRKQVVKLQLAFFPFRTSFKVQLFIFLQKIEVFSPRLSIAALLLK